MGEVGFAASFLQWFAEEARRAYGDTIPSAAADKRMVTIRQAAGVAAMITPVSFDHDDMYLQPLFTTFTPHFFYHSGTSQSV